jgi:hypothetical protein
MDPLSITLSVITLLELTRKVIVYVRQTKDAPNDRTRVIQEASSLTGLLGTLKELLEDSDFQDPWLQATSSLTAPDGPFQQYKILLETVVARVVPSHGSSRKLGQALAWLLSKDEVMRLLSQIERVKTFILIALEIDHTFVLLLFLLLLDTHHPKCYTTNTNQLESRWYQRNSHSEPQRDVVRDLSLSLVHQG